MDILDKIIAAESSGNLKKANKPNKTSSALGLGQFIDETWLSMIKRYHPELMNKSRAEILAMRTEPELSREMTAKYAEENEKALRDAHLPVTPGSIYLMHFAGPGGAPALLKAEPNTPVESILSKNAIDANDFLRGKTAGWVIAWANKKMANAQASKPSVWDRGGQPIPSLPQMQAVEPAFGATGWPSRPASPNELSPDGARRFTGAPSAALIPFLDGTTRAQQVLDNSLPAPGAAPWELADRFGHWSGLGGVLGPATASHASIVGGYDTPSPPAASVPAPNAPEENIVDVPAVRRNDIRRLTRRDVSNEADVFEAGASPVPYLPYR